MINGISNQLKGISTTLLIKNGGLERINLENSTRALIKNLYQYFGKKIDRVETFGSFSRKTMLLRKFDPESDIDVLIYFHIDGERLRPEAYRERLKKFANETYSEVSIVKDHPSIVIKMEHIYFDLVATTIDIGVVYDTIEIPGKDSDWLVTDPKEFDLHVKRANASNNWLVKPIVRLLKYWNAINNRPFSSYDLEKMIAEMNFYGDNLQRAFFYAIDNLETYNKTEYCKTRVAGLQNQIHLIRTSLEEGDLGKAKFLLGKILPSIN